MKQMSSEGKIISYKMKRHYIYSFYIKRSYPGEVDQGSQTIYGMKWNLAES